MGFWGSIWGIAMAFVFGVDWGFEFGTKRAFLGGAAQGRKGRAG